jgi:hypothetical protein
VKKSSSYPYMSADNKAKIRGMVIYEFNDILGGFYHLLDKLNFVDMLEHQIDAMGNT